MTEAFGRRRKKSADGTISNNPLRILCRVGALSAALCFAAPSGADDVAWLGGDMVQVAPRRLDEMVWPSSHPLMGYLARPDAPGRHPAVVELHGCGEFGTMDVAAAEVVRLCGVRARQLSAREAWRVGAGGPQVTIE